MTEKLILAEFMPLRSMQGLLNMPFEFSFALEASTKR